MFVGSTSRQITTSGQYCRQKNHPSI